MIGVRSWWAQQQFFPSGIGIILSPSFLIRRGLAHAIAPEAKAFSGRILDFGCGSKPYESVFLNASEYIGVDIEVSGHNHAELNSKIDVFYDGSKLPFENDEFDGVVAFEVFEHVFEPDVVIPELHRVMKAGGALIVTTPFVWPEHEEPYDYARYSTFGLKHLFEKHGFKVSKVVRVGTSYETVFQILSNVVAQKTGDWSRLPRLMAQVGLVFPINLIGLVLSAVLPNMSKLYLNNMLVAQK